VTVAPSRAWQSEALCRGNQAQLFFPPSTIEICGVCPVRRDCSDYAVGIREPYGIWGGYTEVERRQLLAQGVTRI
jgi:WhiB family redox-sensing transcriptional regulator